MRPGSAAVLAAALAAVVPCPVARAWPGSIRWGYANCVSCHFNVAGGGVLTRYGRAVSKELLTTGSAEREVEFAYGRLQTPAWLALGGDFRYDIASRRDVKSLHLRQADLEGAVTHGRWLAVATFGRIPAGATSERFGSRRHYVQYQATPLVSARVGRFLPNYGIWNGDLGAATRRGLGWDEDTYNAEVNFVGERASGSGTVLLGRPWDAVGAWETGFAASAHLVLARRHKLGISLTRKASARQRRAAAGIFVALGLGRHGQIVCETDVQRRRPAGPTSPSPEWSLYANWEIAREVFVHGLYVTLSEELAHVDWRRNGRVSSTPGLGVRWFPRPHFEMQARWRHRDRQAVSPLYLDGFTALVRFYP